jgi:hypothetical protein
MYMGNEDFAGVSSIDPSCRSVPIGSPAASTGAPEPAAGGSLCFAGREAGTFTAEANYGGDVTQAGDDAPDALLISSGAFDQQLAMGACDAGAGVGAGPGTDAGLTIGDMAMNELAFRARSQFLSADEYVRILDDRRGFSSLLVLKSIQEIEAKPILCYIDTRATGKTVECSAKLKFQGFGPEQGASIRWGTGGDQGILVRVKDDSKREGMGMPPHGLAPQLIYHVVKSERENFVPLLNHSAGDENYWVNKQSYILHAIKEADAPPANRKKCKRKAATVEAIRQEIAKVQKRVQNMIDKLPEEEKAAGKCAALEPMTFRGGRNGDGDSPSQIMQDLLARVNLLDCDCAEEIEKTSGELEKIKLEIEQLAGRSYETRVLLILSCAADSEKLNLEKEKEQLLEENPGINFEILDNPSLREIFQKMTPVPNDPKAPFDFVHFSGHSYSRPAGNLAFVSASSSEELAPVEGFALLIAKYHHKFGLSGVVLSACNTLQQGEALVKAGVPNVVCTTDKISDEVAQLYSTAFYSQVSSCFSVKESHENAKESIEFEQQEIFCRGNGSSIQLKTGLPTLGPNFSRFSNDAWSPAQKVKAEAAYLKAGQASDGSKLASQPRHVELRLYQAEAVRFAQNQGNMLVCLPTGAGTTIICTCKLYTQGKVYSHRKNSDCMRAPETPHKEVAKLGKSVCRASRKHPLGVSASMRH